MHFFDSLIIGPLCYSVNCLVNAAHIDWVYWVFFLPCSLCAVFWSTLMAPRTRWSSITPWTRLRSPGFRLGVPSTRWLTCLANNWTLCVYSILSIARYCCIRSTRSMRIARSRSLWGPFAWCILLRMRNTSTRRYCTLSCVRAECCSARLILKREEILRLLKDTAIKYSIIWVNWYRMVVYTAIKPTW